MAEIFLLAERRGRRPGPSVDTAPRKAEILFFTGIRYERLDGQIDGHAPVDKSPVAKKRRSNRVGKR